MAKRDRAILEALQKPIWIAVSDKIQGLNWIKYQRVELDVYNKLRNEFMKLSEKLEQDNLHSRFLSFQKRRINRIEKQLYDLVGFFG